MRTGKDLVRARRQEHGAHEPVISELIVAEVPLAGLSSSEGFVACNQGCDRSALAAGRLDKFIADATPDVDEARTMPLEALLEEDERAEGRA